MLSELFDLLIDGTINRIIFHRILDLLAAGTKEPPTEVSKFKFYSIFPSNVDVIFHYSSQIVKRENWYQINDRSILEESCKLTIEFNPECVEEYKNSKKLLRKKNFQKLMDEAINHTHKRANLKAIKEILEKLLNTK